MFTLPSALFFIRCSTRSNAGFPVVSPRAAIRSALLGSSKAPNAEPNATAACCHPFSYTRAYQIGYEYKLLEFGSSVPHSRERKRRGGP